MAATLDPLQEAFDESQSLDLEPLRQAVLRLAEGPALFVGTGGTLAVARLAANLHELLTGHVARVMTPYELLTAPRLRAGLMFLAARARHADAIQVAKLIASGTYRNAVVVTGRDAAELAELAGAAVPTVTLSPLARKEGFPASASVVLLASALGRAYGHELGEGFPPTLSEVDAAALCDRVVVVYGAEMAPVALDLEARLAESGLAACQTTDLRNFAHGRHTGLAREISRTPIVVISGPESRPLADATVAVLPPEAMVHRLGVADPVPRGIIAGLASSAALVARLGERAGLDVMRPEVPMFGRRLYRLPLTSRLPSRKDGPVARKLEALAGGDLDGRADAVYRRALPAWLEQVADTRIGGIVLDYDGTVCETSRPFEPPDASLQESLLGLLQSGMLVGFASGRGKSLHRDAREWIPKAFWPQVQLGLYNGGVQLSLADPLPDLRRPSLLMQSVAERIQAADLLASTELTVRSQQVTVELGAHSFMPGRGLRELVADALQAAPALPVKVVTSGHSVDVVPAEAGKTAVVDLLRVQAGDVLAVGDQGMAGGNDFEMLATVPLSLSVDRCSADPTRCWFLGDGRVSGPPLLKRYLSALEPRFGAWHFRWMA